ncbi:MAG: cytochrome ubiquinol oxidase subunit I, partial [Prochlorothrix sp.]
QVYEHQPSKLAAIEARWETVPAGDTAPWSILALPNANAEKNDFELNIPQGLGYILEFKPELSAPVLGLKEFAPADRPPMIGLIFYCFRIMAGIGVFFAGLMGVTLLQWLRGKLSPESIVQQTWLLWAWVLAAPLGYVAVETGWTVREVGRQPWTVYGLIRTSDAASQLPASNVLVSLIAFTVVYSLLLIATLYFGSRILRQGPNLDLPLPGSEDSPPADPSGEFVPDRRPLEAQR